MIHYLVVLHHKPEEQDNPSSKYSLFSNKNKVIEEIQRIITTLLERKLNKYDSYIQSKEFALEIFEKKGCEIDDFYTIKIISMTNNNSMFSDNYNTSDNFSVNLYIKKYRLKKQYHYSSESEETTYC